MSAPTGPVIFSNPIRALEQFARQVFAQVNSRDLSQKGKARRKVIAEVIHTLGEQESRLRQLGAAAMSAWRGTGFAAPVVEGRVKALEAAVKRVLFFELDNLKLELLSDLRMSGRHQIEEIGAQRNQLVNALEPVRSLADALGGGEVAEEPAEAGPQRCRDADTEVATIGLELAPGGFSCRGEFHPLTGRARQMLVELLSCRHHRCTADELRSRMKIDDQGLEFPEKVVIDSAKKLRATLKKAWQKAGIPVRDPLPSEGKGGDLTYTLVLPDV